MENHIKKEFGLIELDKQIKNLETEILKYNKTDNYPYELVIHNLYMECKKSSDYEANYFLALNKLLSLLEITNSEKLIEPIVNASFNEKENFKCKNCKDTGKITKTEWTGTDDSYDVEINCNCNQ